MLHPAAQIPFDQLVNGLQEQVAQKLVQCQPHPSYSNIRIYNYTKDCMFSKSWNEYTVLARGLILDHDSKKIVAYTFPKFFNFGEAKDKLPDLPFTVSEKMDGSLGVISYFHGDWHVSTRGSFISEQAAFAKDWLAQNIDLTKMDKNTTYLVEIIYPANRVVVSYDFSGLVLLGAYSNGHEIEPSELLSVANNLGLRSARFYSFDSIEQLVATASTLGNNFEGFVVRYSNGHRFKLKGDAYCLLHGLISNITPLSIWTAMMEDRDLNELVKSVPEEFHRDFHLIHEILVKQKNALLEKLTRVHEQTKNLSNKELGLSLKELTAQYGQVVSFLFSYREPDKFNSGSTRRNFYRLFRPDANKLEGYSPSNAMNRFSAESG